MFASPVISSLLGRTISVGTLELLNLLSQQLIAKITGIRYEPFGYSLDSSPSIDTSRGEARVNGNRDERVALVLSSPRAKVIASLVRRKKRNKFIAKLTPVNLVAELIMWLLYGGLSGFQPC